MKPLTEEHLAILRRHMVELVEMHFDLAGDEIGERTLDPALRRALMEVPRHLFVPLQLAGAAYQDTRCRSASTRRCRSRSSAR
jgi:protein-L-isoaspartate(D-aspartate) O-methyltransferase